MEDTSIDIRIARRRDFARQLARWQDPISRRRFLELMGASLALAGLAGCSYPPNQRIVPYVRQPEEVVPGKPLYYASAALLGGYASGVLVESHLGRPTKVEGNPQHPVSLGATDAFAQASVLTLYDPSRAQTVTNRGQISNWSAFRSTLSAAMSAQRARQGAGLRILTETITSPTLANQLDSLLRDLPQAKWHQYEPLARDNARAGVRLAFGQALAYRYRLDAADVILALDGDFLAWEPGSVRYIRDFAARRQPRPGQPALNRVYVVESTPSTIGAVADHRLPLPARQIEPFARALAAALGLAVGGGSPQLPPGVPDGWLRAMVNDLQQHRGASLVVVGDGQPPLVHALAHALNQALGNIGRTIEYTDPIEAAPTDHGASLRELVDDMQAGRVEVLAILGGNPVYTAPADLGFADALTKVGLRFHLGLFEDETSALCHWHIPETHPLETWSDARAYDGTVTILQPLIAPLYADSKSAHELLAALADQEQSGHDVVKGYWQSQYPGGDFETFWRTALHDGVVPDTALPARTVAVRPDWTAGAASPPAGPRAGELEIVFRPDPSTYDGRFASNAWLLELPRPLSKLTWGNAAQLSPATAARLGLEDGTVVELRYRGRSVRAPILVQPGQADDSVTVTLGYGRTRGAGAGIGVGFNAYSLRTAAAPWFDGGLELVPTGAREQLAIARDHHRMEGRELVRATTAAALQAGTVAPAPEPTDSLYPPYAYTGYAWGMVIDLSACVGCNACIVACQAENNIPVVGKEEVLRGREMHWLRVDTYYEGPAENPRVYHQLVPCMHCENAPCELVCPVNATVHSDEGLNDMVYNRCIGTRYCSNNCPYKVRRFNFFQYSDWDTASLKALRNPDVTVRSRGVMEKCTYCVQRITHARIQAETEGRRIADGEVLTACQAACPAGAIVFGDLNDPNSQVARLRADRRNYALLAELNTRPRTTYLMAVRNPNPTLEAE